MFIFELGEEDAALEHREFTQRWDLWADLSLTVTKVLWLPKLNHMGLRIQTTDFSA